MTKNQKGVGLLEAVIYVAIVGMISTALVSFMIDVALTSQKSKVEQEVQQSIRFVMEKIQTEILAATAVIRIDSVFDDDNGKLVLATPGGDVEFSIGDGKIRLIKDTQTFDLTTSDTTVNKLRFTDLSVSGRNDTIRVSLEIAHANLPSLEVLDATFQLRGNSD